MIDDCHMYGTASASASAQLNPDWSGRSVKSLSVPVPLRFGMKWAESGWAGLSSSAWGRGRGRDRDKEIPPCQ